MKSSVVLQKKPLINKASNFPVIPQTSRIDNFHSRKKIHLPPSWNHKVNEQCNISFNHGQLKAPPLPSAAASEYCSPIERFGVSVKPQFRISPFHSSSGTPKRNTSPNSNCESKIEIVQLEQDKSILDRCRGGFRCTTSINSFKIQKELGKIHEKDKEEKMIRSISTLLQLHMKRLNFRESDKRDLKCIDLHEMLKHQQTSSLMSILDIARESQKLRRSLPKCSPREEPPCDYIETRREVSRFTRKPHITSLNPKYRKRKKQALSSVNLSRSDLWWRQFRMDYKKQLSLNKSIDSLAQSAQWKISKKYAEHKSVVNNSIKTAEAPDDEELRQLVEAVPSEPLRLRSKR